ncbi:hypothetical protein I5Q34_03605 [Streptomyces sp. AV19]|uniref:hypothetical protein n=1 Tax=Streptomyces sp. AV19 TaxID=2793068 RepID=UPI0018FEAAC8|nr:hypothetical protein [Streptomyces sp. AV19]MBH1933379.1 hypothetical protein [Streptomyces sp. AV19]MDG4531990.1 hypothetical protein [Streptomyces sp. AV19]
MSLVRVRQQSVRQQPCAEEINRAIRAFLSERRGRALTAAERREYERLRTDWLAAGRTRRWGCG